MSDVQTLLIRCRELGATLTPEPDGKLKLKAPAPLPEELCEELRQRKAEVLALLTRPYLNELGELIIPPVAEQSIPAPPWPCEHCGNQAQIEAVEPSLDGQRMLTYWHCPPCQTWGVTPESIKQPPVWVSKREQ